MIAHRKREVKYCEDCRRAHGASRWDQFRCFVDSHPRYWWFWTIILGLNTLLNMLDLFGFGGH